MITRQSGNRVSPGAMKRTSKVAMQNAFSDTSRTEMASAFKLVIESTEDWSPTEYGSIIDHILTIPFGEFLVDCGVKSMSRLDQLAFEAQPSITNLYDLISHGQPPRELLVALKDFAKTQLTGNSSLLPPTISRLLYVTAIIDAKKHGVTISNMDNENIKLGRDWALGLEWIPDKLRSVLACS